MLNSRDNFYHKTVLNFAHRGARLKAPENTIEAFELAYDLGADGVELDVLLSRDGVPVIIHDFSVDTTTNGHGRVREFTLKELKEMDAGSYFGPEFRGLTIPTLDEVFEAIGSKLLINVELKSMDLSPHLAQMVVDCVERHGLQSRVILSSFNPVTLRHVRRLAPNMLVGILYAGVMPFYLFYGWVACSIVGRYEALHPHFSQVNQGYIDRARQEGYHVNVWTVNKPADIKRMVDLGVDLIISDVPDVVRDIVG